MHPHLLLHRFQHKRYEDSRIINICNVRVSFPQNAFRDFVLQTIMTRGGAALPLALDVAKAFASGASAVAAAAGPAAAVAPILGLAALVIDMYQTYSAKSDHFRKSFAKLQERVERIGRIVSGFTSAPGGNAPAFLLQTVDYLSSVLTKAGFFCATLEIMHGSAFKKDVIFADALTELIEKLDTAVQECHFGFSVATYMQSVPSYGTVFPFVKQQASVPQQPLAGGVATRFLETSTISADIVHALTDIFHDHNWSTPKHDNGGFGLIKRLAFEDLGGVIQFSPSNLSAHVPARMVALHHQFNAYKYHWQVWVIDVNGKSVTRYYGDTSEVTAEQQFQALLLGNAML